MPDGRIVLVPSHKYKAGGRLARPTFCPANEMLGLSMSFAAARHNMVESQLRTNRVTDEAILAAFDTVPRELFVPAPMRSIAYVDEDLEVAPGRAMMEPMVLARLLQAADIRPEDVALAIGCGSGYCCAILARIANTVVAIESDSELVHRAGRILSDLSIDNVVFVEGHLAEGNPDQAPYDVILIDGAVEQVPDGIQRQLAEGGRLVTVVQRGSVGRATLMTRRGGVVSSRVLFDAAVPMLAEFAVEPGFVF